MLPKMGCREQACAGGGRPELFIDAIRKRKAHTPAVSALLPGAHMLSALPGAVEDGSHPLSCHSVSSRVKTLLLLGENLSPVFYRSYFCSIYMTGSSQNAFYLPWLFCHLAPVFWVQQNRAVVGTPTCCGGAASTLAPYSHPCHLCLSKTLLPSSSQPDTPTPILQDTAATAFPSPGPGSVLAYILFASLLFASGYPPW